MHKWQTMIALLIITVLGLSGCGRKEAPQIGGNDKPEIHNLKDRVVGNVLELDFKLTGSSQGVGYHVDRTEVDPYCQCPGFWRRFYDRPPLAIQANIQNKRLIKLKNARTEYMFRIRAYDGNGNIGPWSRAIRAKGVDLSR